MELDTDNEKISLLLAGGHHVLVGVAKVLDVLPDCCYGLFCGGMHVLFVFFGMERRVEETVSVCPYCCHVFIHCLGVRGVNEEHNLVRGVNEEHMCGMTQV